MSKKGGEGEGWGGELVWGEGGREGGLAGREGGRNKGIEGREEEGR